MEYLTADDLLAIADELRLAPVRDFGLLDSAAHRPQASYQGQDAYPDLYVKAAALLESILRNRALIDGNKRLAWAATMVFARLNGVHIRAPHAEAYDLIHEVIVERADLDVVARRLRDWSSQD